MKGSKELNDIIKAINEWAKKHKGNVQFIASFMAFKGKDFDVIDDRIFAYGVKETLRLDLKELDTQVCEEKGGFVSW